MDGLTCKEFIEFLDDYLAGGQSAEARAVFESHVSACPCCTRYLEHYRRTIETAHKCCCNRSQPPPEVPEDLVRAILRAREAGGVGPS